MVTSAGPCFDNDGSNKLCGLRSLLLQGIIKANSGIHGNYEDVIRVHLTSVSIGATLYFNNDLGSHYISVPATTLGHADCLTSCKKFTWTKKR